MKKMLLILSVLLTCAYPCMFIYFQNVGEGNLKQVILPFCYFVGIALVLLIITALFLRQLSKAALFTSLFMLMIMNFNMINGAFQKLIPGLQGRYLLILYLLIYLGIFFVLKQSKWDAALVCEVICGVFGFLILMNGIMALPDISQKLQFQKEKKVELEMEGNYEKANVNVYYMIFDEYGGPQGLDYYYDFDNKEFINFLENAGFSYSKSSYNRESIDTVDIVPNVLNLDYVTEIGGTSENNRNYTENPVLYQFFRNMGYQINMVNHREFLKSEGCNVLTSHQKKDTADTLTDYIINQSILSNIITRVAPEKSSISLYAEGLMAALNDMKYAWEEATNEPTFTICYLQCPHTGFVFDRDGKRRPEEDNLNWLDKSIYIDQLFFLNQWIEEMVEEIQIHDPGAVIVMQSDHGVRYAKHCMYLYSEEEYDAIVETEYMQNILNVVYRGNGELIEIEGLSAINTWRKVLNVVFDCEFEMLSEPTGYVYEWRKLDGIQ